MAYALFLYVWHMLVSGIRHCAYNEGEYARTSATFLVRSACRSARAGGSLVLPRVVRAIETPCAYFHGILAWHNLPVYRIPLFFTLPTVPRACACMRMYGYHHLPTTGTTPPPCTPPGYLSSGSFGWRRVPRLRTPIPAHLPQPAYHS